MNRSIRHILSNDGSHLLTRYQACNYTDELEQRDRTYFVRSILQSTVDSRLKLAFIWHVQHGFDLFRVSRDIDFISSILDRAKSKKSDDAQKVESCVNEKRLTSNHGENTSIGDVFVRQFASYWRNLTNGSGTPVDTSDSEQELDGEGINNGKPTSETWNLDQGGTNVREY